MYNNLDHVLACFNDAVHYELDCKITRNYREYDLVDLAIKNMESASKFLGIPESVDIDLLLWCNNLVFSSDPRQISKRSMGGFGYHGDTPIGVNWAICYSYAPNVASLLEDSNWEVITDDMLERFPEDTTIERFSSWFTPTENLMVRLLDDAGLPTEAASAIKEWRDRLEDYPVANEEHWSNLEYESEFNCIEEYVSYHVDRDDLPENHLGLIWETLRNNNAESENGWFGDDDLEEACQELGYIDIDSDSE